MTEFERDQFLWGLKAQIGSIDEKCDNIAAEQTEIKNIVFGDGGDDKPGLRVRVDRMEQRGKIAGAVAGAAATGVVGLFIERVSRIFQGH